MIQMTEDFYNGEARKLINSKMGIIKSCYQKPRLWGECSYFQYTCELTTINHIIKEPVMPRYSTSASLSKNQAEIGAIVEGLERYCSVIKYFDERPQYSSYDELENEYYFPIEDLPACTDSEYSNPFNFMSEPDQNTKYRWSVCNDIINNRNVLIPSSFIYLYQQLNEIEEVISTPNSTGTAGHVNMEMAITSALLEALERDAIMITWLNQLPRTRIDISSLRDMSIQKRIKAITVDNSEIFLFDIRTDFNVPIVMAINKSNSYPFLTVTAAAKLTYKDAIKRALDEVYTTRNYGKANEKKFKLKNYNNGFNNVVEFEDHYFLYNKPEMITKVDFLLNSESVTDINELNKNVHFKNRNGNSYKFLIDQFKEKNYNVIIKDITTSDLTSSLFKFVKVFTPELVVLSPNHNSRFLRNKRIKNVLPEIGFGEILDKKITDLPHPFA